MSTLYLLNQEKPIAFVFENGVVVSKELPQNPSHLLGDLLAVYWVEELPVSRFDVKRLGDVYFLRYQDGDVRCVPVEWERRYLVSSPRAEYVVEIPYGAGAVDGFYFRDGTRYELVHSLDGLITKIEEEGGILALSRLEPVPFTRCCKGHKLYIERCGVPNRYWDEFREES